MSLENRRLYETKKVILKDIYERELREINERLRRVALEYEEGLENIWGQYREGRL